MKKLILLIMLSFATMMLCAKDVTVTGVVLDDTGDTLVGVSVVLKGTTKGVQTDVDGKFSFIVPDNPGGILVFSLVGMATEERAIADNMQVIMHEESKLLDEVVVVAYGTATKESLVGSINVVSAADISNRTVSNIGSALEGMGTGIRVNSSGEPGGGASIRIRGVSSVIGGEAPLIVLDGMTFQGTLSSINPEDIESMSVLKDASSTAMYGSRAASGVILINTKRAKAGQHKVNFSVKQGFTKRAMKEYKRADDRTFMNTMWNSYRNGLMYRDKKPMSLEQANEFTNNNLISDNLKYNIYDKPDNELFENGRLRADAQILPMIGGDLDWFKEAERTGYRQEYNLNGAAATDMVSLFYSMGYLTEDGYMKNADYNRYSGRINASYKAQKWLKLGLNLSASYSKQNALPDGTSYGNPFGFARHIAPIYPVYVHDLQTGEYLLDAEGRRQYDDGGTLSRPQNQGRHAIWENQLDTRRYNKLLVGIQPHAEVSFLHDFKFILDADITLRDNKLKKYDNKLVGDGVGGKGRASLDTDNFREYTFRQQLFWKRSFNKKHNLEATFVHEYYDYQREHSAGSKSNQGFPGIEELGNFSQITDFSGYKDRYKLESYVGRAKYNFENKYFVEGSFRRDGSSIFHKDSRWGNFWGVGGSWIASSEKFLEDQKWLDMLKIRSSYGETGNDGFSSSEYYAYLSKYTIDKNGNLSAAYRTTDSDPNVTWEAMTEFSLGVDLRVFDRVNFSFDYFRRNNEDLLFDVKRPLSVGSTNTTTPSPTIRRNAGTLRNSGFELAMDVDILKRKDLKWNVGANISFVKNKFIKLPDQMKNGYRDGTKLWMEGKSRYEFHIYQWAGVDQMTGESLYLLDPDQEATAIKEGTFREINGVKYTNSYTHGKRDFSGSALPKATGSFNSSLTYKGITLSMLFTYGIGGKIIDSNYATYMSVGEKPSALHMDVANAWKEIPKGMTVDSRNRIDSKGVPMANSGWSTRYTSSSTQYLTSATYLAFKNISLNYQFPTHLIKKLNISDLKLSASVENVGIFSKRKGLDPQQSFNGTVEDKYIPTRTFSFALNFSF